MRSQKKQEKEKKMYNEVKSNVVIKTTTTQDQVSRKEEKEGPGKKSKFLRDAT